jgi:hypothetical protein
MTETTDILTFSIPQRIKDLLRLRAAKRKTSISEIAREVFLHNVDEPTPEELVFLASDVQPTEDSVQD